MSFQNNVSMKWDRERDKLLSYKSEVTFIIISSFLNLKKEIKNQHKKMDSSLFICCQPWAEVIEQPSPAHSALRVTSRAGVREGQSTRPSGCLAKCFPGYGAVMVTVRVACPELFSSHDWNFLRMTMYMHNAVLYLYAIEISYRLSVKGRKDECFWQEECRKAITVISSKANRFLFIPCTCQRRWPLLAVLLINLVFDKSSLGQPVNFAVCWASSL